MNYSGQLHKVYPPIRNSRHDFMVEVESSLERANEQADSFFAHPDFNDQTEMEERRAAVLMANRSYCCCHVKIPAVILFVFCAISHGLKYSLMIGDAEVINTLMLVNYDIDVYAGRLTIFCVQTFCLLGFLTSLFTNYRYCLIPYLLYQFLLVAGQYIVSLIYIVSIVLGGLGSFKRGCEQFLNIFEDVDFLQRLARGGEISSGMTACCIVLILVINNLFIFSIVKRLYTYMKSRAAYYNSI